MFEVYFRPRALKVLKKIKRDHQLRINSALDTLKLGRFDLLDLDKIEGTQRGWRLRVGRWRILFALFDKEKRIEIVDIFLRKGKDYKKRIKLIK
jgi:mRNA-degrading endonuclease RelE of RelBE toxin-antitoxin system